MEAAVVPDCGRRTLMCWLLLFLCFCAGSGRADPVLKPALGSAIAAKASTRWQGLADTVFQHQTMEHGLPHPIVTALGEDVDGFIWVGTQAGLARWDGYRFRTFQSNPLDAASLPDSAIQILHLDRRGRLWIVCNNGSLVRYDNQHERFIRISFNGGAAALVTALADDGQDGLWVGTSAGLRHIQSDSVQIETVPQALAAHMGLERRIYRLLHDREGRLWIGAEHGLILHDRYGYHQVDLPSIRPAWPAITHLAQSSDGKVWAGTNDQGVFVIPPASANASQRPQRLDIGGNQDVANSPVLAMAEIKPGEIWLGTDGLGVVAIDSASLQIRHLRHDVSLPAGLPSDVVWSILRDRSGLVWLGSHEGVSHFDPGQTVLMSLSGGKARSEITSILPVADGSILLGARTGMVNRVDPAANQLSAFLQQPESPNSGLPRAPIYAFGVPQAGWLYISSRLGLYRASMDGSKLEKLEAFSGKGRFGAMLQIGQQLWLGSLQGLWRVDLAAGQAVRPQRAPGAAALDQLDVLVLEPGANGVIWIGTRTHGVYRYDSRHGTLFQVQPDPANAKGLAHHFITSILLDSRGWLWVGTYGGGLNLCRTPDQAGTLQFTRIGSAQGLPNPIVDKVLEDPAGNIWVSTDAGLASIQAQSLAVRVHGRADGGAIGMFFRNSGARTRHGELLFGGDSGLVVVRPERLTQWDYSPPVVISEMQAGGKVVPVGHLNRLGPALGRVVLPADANSLTVEFSALDFSAPGLNHYAYRLDGVDRDWIETPNTRRLASYANLAPGTYQLHLRGSNRNGVWARQERVLSVIVLPAWYQTWWCYTLLALLTLLLMASLVQVRTRFLRQRQDELKAQVEQGIVELREKQAQLVQQEKMASLGTLTAGIAHEINNPSNFAHVGAYNLGNELADLHRFLLKLAGDEASPELLQALQQRFDNLAASLGAISEGTTRIRDLVRDLRTFSRLDEADWKIAAIGDSLLATVNLVRTQYADQVEMRCELNANPEIECWPAQLNQVFMNLIVNACQAIISRPPDVRAAVPGCLLIRSWQEAIQQENQQQTMLVLEFSDNGTGIAPELLEKIFDPFFTTKTVGEGMGMGLSISFGIIAKHHGTMTVSSTLGQGACFTLRLPITTTDSSQN